MLTFASQTLFSQSALMQGTALMAGSSLGAFQGIASQITNELRLRVPIEQVTHNIAPQVESLTVDEESPADLVTAHSLLMNITSGHIPIESGALEHALQGASRYITLFAQQSEALDQLSSTGKRRALTLPPRTIVPPSGKEDQIFCSVCNYWNPLENDYCGKCSSQLKEEVEFELVGKNRHGTILFTDMKNFTAATDGLTPGELLNFVNRIFEALGEVVMKYDGHINKTMGDALMAAFGALPHHTYENHAERAVRAARDMLRVLEPLNRELEQEGRPTVQIRIGINTGTFSAGVTGAAKLKEFDVIGMSVNVASRCESLKLEDTSAQDELQLPEGNRIIATEQTLSELGGSFEVKSLGPVRVKGVKDPVGMYLVTGENPEQSVIRARGETAATFQGRKRELDSLRDVFAEAAQGQPRIALVVANAGQGKSRLATEFLKSARDPQGREIVRIETKGIDREAHPPYYYLSDALKRLAHINPSDSADEIEIKVRGLVRLAIEGNDQEREMPAQLLAYLIGYPLQQQPEEMEYLLKEASLMRTRIQEVVMDLFKGLSTRQLVILALEDIQWADRESLELIRSVLEELAGEQKEGSPYSLMVLGLARPKFTRDHPDFFAGDYAAPPIELGELSQDALHHIAKDLLADAVDAADQAEILNFLVAQAGGNPYVLHAMARAAREGWLTRDEATEQWQFIGTDGKKVPAGARSFLQARIRNLSQEEQQLLKIAAVVGDDVSFESLRSLGIAEPAEVIQLLISKEFMKRDDTDRFNFRHALIRETVLGLMDAADKQALHLSVAGYYEAQGVADVAIIASHFENAGQDEQAANYYYKAGEAHAKGGFFQSAVFAYSKAHFLFKDPIRQGEALYGWADSLFFNRRYQDQLGLLDKFDDILQRIPAEARDIRARMLNHKALALAYNRLYQEAERVIEEGLNLYNKNEAAETKARFLNLLGTIYWQHHKDYDRARECFQRALEGARQIGDSYLIGASLNNLSLVGLTVGDYSMAYSYGMEAVDVRKKAGDLKGLLHALTNVGSALMSTGDYQNAAHIFDEGISASRQKFNEYFLNYLLSNYGETLRFMGDVTGALSTLKDALEIHRSQPNTLMSGMTHVYMSLSYRDAGDMSAARREAKRAMEIAQTIDDESLEATAKMSIAQTYLAQDQLQDALRRSQRAVDLLNKLGVVEEFDLEILLTHANILTKLGQHQDAWSTIDRARRELKARSDKITDKDHRKSFTERVKVNVQILKQWDLLKFITTRQVEPIIAELLSSLDYYTPAALPELVRFVDVARNSVDTDAVRRVITSYSEESMRHRIIRQLLDTSIAIQETRRHSRAGVVVKAPLSDLLSSLLTKSVKVDRNEGSVPGVWAEGVRWEPFFGADGKLYLLIEWKLNSIAHLHKVIFPIVGQRAHLKQLMHDSIYARDGVVYISLTEEPQNKITAHDGTIIQVIPQQRVDSDQFGDISFSLAKLSDDETLIVFELEKELYTDNARNFLREFLLTHFESTSENS